MSFSLHSSTENLGGGRRSSSSGSNSNSSCNVSLKSLIGEMSWNASALPSCKNHFVLKSNRAARGAPRDCRTNSGPGLQGETTRILLGGANKRTRPGRDRRPGQGEGWREGARDGQKPRHGA